MTKPFFARFLEKAEQAAETETETETTETVQTDVKGGVAPPTSWPPYSTYKYPSDADEPTYGAKSPWNQN